MHGGGGGPVLFIRQYLTYGRPWQRAAVVVALVVGGVVVIGAGNLIGVVPAVIGVVIAVRTWGPLRLRAQRFRPAVAPRSPEGEDSD